jgi:hypothetical protein
MNPDGIHVAAIQTLVNEASYEKLDLVMLTRLPVHDSVGRTLPLDLFTPGDTTNAHVLLRNKAFADHPDGPKSSFTGWASVGPKLPDTPLQVCVGGGHTNPVYFVVAADAAGVLTMYKLMPVTRGGAPRWRPILTGLLSAGEAPNGSAFVNPQDPDMIFAVAADGSHPDGAVFLSLDGGSRFETDEVLTGLLTNSSQFGLGVFDGSSPAAELGSTFHGGPMFNPSQIACSPSNPSFVVATSPVAGVFFANVATGCLSRSTRDRKTEWRTLKPFMPNPFGYISGAAFDTASVYVATQGRGLLYVDDPFVAPPATYFDPIRLGTTSLAVLRDNTASPVPWARVSVLMTRIEPGAQPGVPFERRTVDVDRLVRTDEMGVVVISLALKQGTYLVELVFPGDGTLAQCETRFLFVRT